MFTYAERKQTPKDTLQKKESVKTPVYSNQTGIPNNMKARFENLSGFSFDDVRVHYNSDKPAQLQALAYTQGNQVYIGPGQEKHLGHELGHVVQQKQGIVKPVSYIGSVPVNTDSLLEKNADKIFEDTNKVHETVAQLKREAGKGHSENSTAQLVGGRDKDWSKLSPQKINQTYQTLANKLVNHYNKVLKNVIEDLNKVPFRKQNPIRLEDHKLMLSGSTLVMGIAPDRFVADDIDLDYYNNKSANKFESLGLDLEEIVWTNLAKNFGRVAFRFKDDDFIAEKTEVGDCAAGLEIREFKIHLYDDPRPYYINVELKNITSKAWHKGWREGAKRDVGDTKISEEQLYMDTCLRIDGAIPDVRREFIKNMDIPKEELSKFQQQVKASLDTKQCMLKKDILKKSLGKRNKYQGAKAMARRKLQEDTYDRWNLISESEEISVEMLSEYQKKMNKKWPC